MPNHFIALEAQWIRQVESPTVLGVLPRCPEVPRQLVVVTCGCSLSSRAGLLADPMKIVFIQDWKFFIPAIGDKLSALGDAVVHTSHLVR